MVTLKKTMTYSIMHVTVAFLVAYAISGNFAVAAAISLIEPMVQTVCYFFHERAWNRHLKNTASV